MAARKTTPKTATCPVVKPEPIPTQVKCSVCGLPWEPHGEDPDVNDCIRLLRAELVKRPIWNHQQAIGTTVGSGLTQPLVTRVA